MYTIGQIFEHTYTIDVAKWCNSNNCYIQEIEPLEDGTRRYEIKECKPYVETKEEKAERIAKLCLTGSDVERAIYKVKGIDFDDIISIVTQTQSTNIDIKDLKIELKANHFYRGNPYVSQIGALLGFTEEQLDNFFTTNDYTKLM